MLRAAGLSLALFALPALALAQGLAKDLPPTGDPTIDTALQVEMPAINADSVASVEIREPGANPEALIGRPVSTIAGDKIGKLVGFREGRAVIDVDDLYGGPLGRINVPARWVTDDTGLPVVVLPLTTLEVRRAAGMPDGGG